MRAPTHLSERAKRLWRAVTDEYELTSIDTELLLRACEAAARADEARQILDREGLTVPGRDAPKAHPMIQVELVNRRAETALLGQLHLDDGPTVDRTAAGRALAHARYEKRRGR